MKQWGGDQNYRPEKKPSVDKKARRSVSRETTATEANSKTERDYRVGKTIAGATNNARKRNLEHIAARKKQQRKNAFIVLCVLIIIASVSIFLINYVSKKVAERETVLTEQGGPTEPTVAIIDENAGNNVSSRAKLFVARLEADAKEYNLKIDHVVLPFQKAREMLVFFDGRKEYYKITSERGSAVQIEDAERMIRYLDSKSITPEYVDLRVEGKAYYK